MTRIVKVILEDDTELLYEFETLPSMDQVDAAMDGIGGRPPDRTPPKH